MGRIDIKSLFIVQTSLVWATRYEGWCIFPPMHKSIGFEEPWPVKISASSQLNTILQTRCMRRIVVALDVSRNREFLNLMMPHLALLHWDWKLGPHGALLRRLSCLLDTRKNIEQQKNNHQLNSRVVVDGLRQRTRMNSRVVVDGLRQRQGANQKLPYGYLEGSEAVVLDCWVRPCPPSLLASEYLLQGVANLARS